MENKGRLAAPSTIVNSNSQLIFTVVGVCLAMVLLLTLIKHPLLAAAVLLAVLWLFLHPVEADGLWRSAIPIISTVFANAVKEIGNNATAASETIKRKTEQKQSTTRKDFRPTILPKEVMTLEDRTERDLERLLALLNDNTSIGGDIEIEPMTENDILKQAGGNFDSSVVRPVPQKRKSKQQNRPAPDLIMMNDNSDMMEDGTPEFYNMTPGQYHRLLLERLILTEQVPRTAEWFEELTEKQKAEWIQEQLMRERLASKVPDNLQ